MSLREEFEETLALVRADAIAAGHAMHPWLRVEYALRATAYCRDCGYKVAVSVTADAVEAPVEHEPCTVVRA